MKNRWDAALAAHCADELALRVYSARLLGAEPDLVLHGGGNCSLKGEQRDVFGEAVPVLYIKGSGWDLRTIETAGFPATRLAHLTRLAGLPSLSDADMMRQLRLALLDPEAPTPSVEALLHALLPHRCVDHTHADAVVAISNSPGGAQALAELYGPSVLILPYVMPGFVLARQVADALAAVDVSQLRGIVLLHHGVFTFAETVKDSYDAMIDLVTRAEDWLVAQGAHPAPAPVPAGVPATADLTRLAELRRAAADRLGTPLLVRWWRDNAALTFSGHPQAADLIRRGPLTPDHTLHCKPFGAVFDADPLPGLDAFLVDYRTYVATHAQPHHQALDPVPRYGLWRDRGVLLLAPTPARLGVVADITQHTLTAVLTAEALGGWAPLPRADLFAVEYWELEQAKLKRAGSPPPFAGRVAVVTGAASGIGRACVEALLSRGAAVAALDVHPAVRDLYAGQPAVLARVCDVTDPAAVAAAVADTVVTFGGIDLVISNAGRFPPSESLASLTEETWHATLSVNLDGHRHVLQACQPYLRLGLAPAVVVIASKNVPAPGPGAGAYSAAKAALTQLARVAALEWAEFGIRVNVLHPDAVFDTGVWTPEVLAQRAARYGLTVAQYKRRNLLQTEVTAKDVAQLACVFLGPDTAKTTGAQVPVDGGNERVV